MTVQEIKDRIQELLTERDWSKTRLAKIAGVATSTITDIWKRDTFPGLPLIDKMCRAFGITVGEFFAFDIPLAEKTILTSEEQRLVGNYRKLSEKKKEKLLDYSDGMVAGEE